VVKEDNRVAGMKGKHESRRVSMCDYENESYEHYGPRDQDGGPFVNIYLLHKSKRSVTQCFNTTRSKHTSEARMYKKGTKSKWHATMKPFIDGTVDC
jgi:hypothetical protein